jgi:hypothetical protein
MGRLQQTDNAAAIGGVLINHSGGPSFRLPSGRFL